MVLVCTMCVYTWLVNYEHFEASVIICVNVLIAKNVADMSVVL